MRRLPLVALLLPALVLAGCSLLAPEAPAAGPGDAGGPVIEEDDDFGTVELYNVLGDGSLRRRSSAGDRMQTLAIAGNLRLCVSQQGEDAR